MKRYFRFWYKVTITSFLSSLANRLSFTIFVFAKSLRVLLFYLFLNLLLGSVGGLASYNRDQVVFSFLNFYLIDSLSQLFLRGVYFFRNRVVEGSFDYVLLRPINALFSVLSGHTDVQDLVVTLGLAVAVVLQGFSLKATPAAVVLYLLLLINGLLISTSFHILIVSFILVSLDIDHAVMVYRDVQSMARFPIEIYREPLRFILTFVIPIGVMIFFPVKVLLGLLSPYLLLVSLLISFFLFFLSLRIWKFSLRSYSSASS